MSTLSPGFSDNEKESDIKAYQQMSAMPKVLFTTEFYVTKALLVNFIVICKNIVIRPLRILTGKWSTPEDKYNVCIFTSMVIALVGLESTGFGIKWGLTYMLSENIYKLWGVYTFMVTIIKFAMKGHKHTHQMIRGAIRSNASPILPILFHAATNAVIFVCYSVCTGTSIAALFKTEQKQGRLFFACCVHIQAAFAKKFLPKPFDNSPLYEEVIQRTMMIINIAFNHVEGSFEDLEIMVFMEYFWTFMRYLLMSLTGDASRFHESMKTDTMKLISECRNGTAALGDSMLLKYPSEIFAMLFISIIIMTRDVQYRNTQLGFILIIAIVGSFVLSPTPQSTPQKVKDEDPPKKKEKKENEKNKLAATAKF